MNFRMYQLGKSDTVLAILKMHMDKHGKPPMILLEGNIDLISSVDIDVPGLKLVKKVAKLPPNTLLIMLATDSDAV